MKQIFTFTVIYFVAIFGFIFCVGYFQLIQRVQILDRKRKFENAKKCNALWDQVYESGKIVDLYVEIGDSLNCSKWSAIKHVADSTWGNSIK